MTALTAAGVDAGKMFLDVAIAPSGATFRVANAADGIATIVERLRRSDVKRIVLEAIGPYAAKLVRTLADQGFEVGIFNPRRIKAFREAEGARAKTDRLDARLIARFAVRMTDQIRPLPNAAQLTAKALATRRRQLVDMIAVEKTRLKQTDDPGILESHRNAIAVLSQQRIEIERQLDSVLFAEPANVHRHELLTSIPGIGKQTATVLLTDLPELGAVDRRAIASLAGLAPHPHQSGTFQGRNQIGGGRPCVRTALYMAALAAARAHPKFRQSYKEMREQGKPAKVAIIAVARKLLVLANSIVKLNVPYSNDLNHQH
jgi:transposase